LIASGSFTPLNSGFGLAARYADPASCIGPPDDAILVRANPMGYTFGMKTAVSIPDEVFARAERFAKQARRSRSEVYSAALREYVARHAPEDVTDAMNRVCAEIDTTPDPLVAAAGRRALERSEW
jgi:predicted transcriptional regulator